MEKQKAELPKNIWEGVREMKKSPYEQDFAEFLKWGKNGGDKDIFSGDQHPSFLLINQVPLSLYIYFIHSSSPTFSNPLLFLFLFTFLIKLNCLIESSALFTSGWVVIIRKLF